MLFVVVAVVLMPHWVMMFRLLAESLLGGWGHAGDGIWVDQLQKNHFTF